METKYRLEDWVGRQMLAFIPMLNPGSPEGVQITLRGVENGGIWAEVDRSPLAGGKPSTIVLTMFLPWPQVVYLAPPPLAQSAGVTH